MRFASPSDFCRLALSTPEVSHQRGVAVGCPQFRQTIDNPGRTECTLVSAAHDEPHEFELQGLLISVACWRIL
jgi:hypothetical protein